MRTPLIFMMMQSPCLSVGSILVCTNKLGISHPPMTWPSLASDAVINFDYVLTVGLDMSSLSIHCIFGFTLPQCLTLIIPSFFLQYEKLGFNWCLAHGFSHSLMWNCLKHIGHVVASSCSVCLHGPWFQISWCIKWCVACLICGTFVPEISLCMHMQMPLQYRDFVFWDNPGML